MNWLVIHIRVMGHGLLVAYVMRLLRIAIVLLRLLRVLRLLWVTLVSSPIIWRILLTID